MNDAAKVAGFLPSRNLFPTDCRNMTDEMQYEADEF